MGAILQHILTGQAPLTETRDRLARLNVSRFQEIPSVGSLVPDLPAYVGAICNKALEFDPEKRYQTPMSMLVEVQAAVAKLKKGLRLRNMATEREVRMVKKRLK